MKEQVKTMYEDIVMPWNTEETICKAMARQRPSRVLPVRLVRGMAGFAAVLLLTFAASPQVRAAVEEWTKKYVFSGVGLTIFEKNEGDTVLAEVHYDTEAPAFAEIREGRLYFTGNAEDMDITDQISPEEPFYYSHENETGHRVHMVVGMDGSIENFGIYTFIQEPEGDWVTGAGRNFLNPATEARYPWVDIVWEKLDIPWPMPGEDEKYEVTTKKNDQGALERIEIAKN